jgi:hypothetical protein
VLVGAVLARFANCLAEGPAPSWLVGVGACLGRHHPGCSLCWCADRPGLLQEKLGRRRLFAIFPGPAAKETHGVMVDRRLAHSWLLRVSAPIGRAGQERANNASSLPATGVRVCDMEERSASPAGRGARFRLEFRLTEADVGERVVVRWRRPAGDVREEIADVLGVLDAFDGGSLRIRKASGELVTIPRDRALAGKTVPPAPRGPRAGRKEGTGHGC